MRHFLRDLRGGLQFRLEVTALLVGCSIIGLNTTNLLFWLGISEKAARGLGVVVWITIFWMLATWWVYLALKRKGLSGERGLTDVREPE